MVDSKSGEVEQYGPRRLWDEVEHTHDQWNAAGQPTRDRLGLTVTAAGEHRFWIDDPASVIWIEDGTSA